MWNIPRENVTLVSFYSELQFSCDLKESFIEALDYSPYALGPSTPTQRRGRNEIAPMTPPRALKSHQKVGNGTYGCGIGHL